jgi:uncharacterized protein YecE (DUF72 family)
MEKYIGCSGYYYNHWKSLFYPEDMPRNKWLIYYAEHFNTVEINNTFYKMPDEKSVKNWYSVTPADFVFAVKGFRFITHLKKLNADNIFIDYLNRFQQTAGLLKEKTGPLLWQLPGNFGKNIPKLEKFCSLLSIDFHHVFEFRNETWFTPEVYELLKKYKHGLCIISGPASNPEGIKITSEIAYIRFHGENSWYRDSYSNEALQDWKNKLDNVGADKLFAYFNNDMNAYAVKNGRYFASLYKEN